MIPSAVESGVVLCADMKAGLRVVLRTCPAASRSVGISQKNVEGSSQGDIMMYFECFIYLTSPSRASQGNKGCSYLGFSSGGLSLKIGQTVRIGSVSLQVYLQMQDKQMFDVIIPPIV